MSTLTVKELAAPTGYDLKIAAGETLDLKSQGTVTMPTGSVLQVVENTYATASQTGGSNFADTGLSASITPSATSSKVLAMVYQPMSVKTDTSSARDVSYNLVRGSTEIAKGAHDMKSDSGTETRKPVTNALIKLDSPNTTSSVTYKTQFKVNAGSSDVYAQQHGSSATMILIEIAG